MLLSRNLLAQVRDKRTSSETRRNLFFTPEGFYVRTQTLVPRLAVASLLVCTLGLYLGFFVAATETPQDATYRIEFLHLPAAWMAALIYLAMVLGAGLGLLYNASLAHMAVQALAPTGALFAFLVLWSDALWDKPMSGTWLLWDSRLATELTLLALFVVLIVLRELFDSAPRVDRLAAVLVLAGSVCLLVLALAIQGGFDPHQGKLFHFGPTSGGALAMQSATLTIAAGFLLYTGAVVVLRLRCVILERERSSDWVKLYVAGHTCHG